MDIDTLIEDLGEAEEDWLDTYEVLREMGPQIVEKLIEKIENSNRLLHCRVMDLLGKIGDQRAIEPLKKAAKITEDDYKIIIGVSGPSITENMAGIEFEVSVEGLWKDYRKIARNALESINQKKFDHN